MNWLKRAFKEAQHQWFADGGGGKQVWQIHLDKFFEVYENMEPTMQGSEFESEYTQQEKKMEIFNAWLQQVPNELKIGNELEPTFRDAVRNYEISQYGFDPFAGTETDEPDVATPSADELADWWQ